MAQRDRWAWSFTQSSSNNVHYEVKIDFHFFVLLILYIILITCCVRCVYCLQMTIVSPASLQTKQEAMLPHSVTLLATSNGKQVAVEVRLLHCLLTPCINVVIVHSMIRSFFISPFYLFFLIYIYFITGHELSNV